MEVNYKELLKCLVSVQRTLSICSKCLEYCNEEEKEFYGDLSVDAAHMIKKIKSQFERK
jgi:hypothetical protein